MRYKILTKKRERERERERESEREREREKRRGEEIDRLILTHIVNEL